MSRLAVAWVFAATIIGAHLPASRVALAAGSTHALPDFTPCDPVSELVEETTRPRAGSDAELAADLDIGFCSEWNPEFANNGHHCCGKFVRTTRRNRRARLNQCAPSRRRGSFCYEMTEEQRRYTVAASSGELGDLLAHIIIEMGRKGEQAHCTVNNGFLSHGRRVIPTTTNRIRLRSPDRCVDFGTDYMVGMMEWVGREVGRRYPSSDNPGLNLVLGDISAPRGGCLTGRSGRRGHASHTAGQDADVGFLTPVEHGRPPEGFHRNFDAKANWWLLKQIFANPFACVKVVFLDKKHIRKLEKTAWKDEDWVKYRRFIRHMPAHKDHLHVRIGKGPGRPGCVADAKPELEMEEGDIDSELEPESDAGGADDAAALEE